MDSSHNADIEKMHYAQKGYVMIDEFLSKVDQLLNFTCYELKNLFYQTMDELFLSEIEIVSWLTYIEEIGIQAHSYTTKELLIFVGLHAKLSLGSDISTFLDKFTEKNPEIVKKFEAWKKLNKLSSYIPITKLGKKYKEFSSMKATRLINYNFYLNDILASCSTYQKQVKDNDLELPFDVEKKYLKKNIFEIKGKFRIVEDQEYDLNDFERIDI
ncbi:hypothetical protein SteCoe_12634 [Stentor coeruleus]|uniref:Uncharacterized protein n=1 Tax=Stentor coeruleus TaxID=5963 RepID=A0A1R2CAA7_9CILI|nr:hypothetical protein SteCoe_12634 [Stentor coeruleus]